MLPLRYARLWRVASALLLLAVLVATVMPAVWFWPARTQIASWVFGADKWAHVAAFMLLCVWFTGFYERRAFWRIGIGLLAFGVLIEVCQRLVGYRSAEWLDIAADGIGIIAGLVIASTGAAGWALRVEYWYSGRFANDNDER